MLAAMVTASAIGVKFQAAVAPNLHKMVRIISQGGHHGGIPVNHCVDQQIDLDAHLREELP